jgi:hypothetical protein
MTPERIKRYDDERLYQPRIHSRRIRELYRISEETGEPMTVLVDQALAEFVDRHRSGGNQRESKRRGEGQDDLAESPKKGGQI